MDLLSVNYRNKERHWYWSKQRQIPFQTSDRWREWARRCQ